MPSQWAGASVRCRSTAYLERIQPPMNDPEHYFVVPTHRLRHVSETIHEYDEHFWRNGYSPQMIVFDDSTPANVEKYFIKASIELWPTLVEICYFQKTRHGLPMLHLGRAARWAFAHSGSFDSGGRRSATSLG